MWYRLPPPPQPGRWADVVHTARGELADPATSVDGIHMVYSEQQQPGESALYVQRLDRGRDAARVALAPAPGEDRMPTYGPNGTWVYFSSNRCFPSNRHFSSNGRFSIV